MGPKALLLAAAALRALFLASCETQEPRAEPAPPVRPAPADPPGEAGRDEAAPAPGEVEGPAPGVPAPRARALLTLRWGGGEARAWSGAVRLDAPEGAGELEWAWLADFEDGDLLLPLEGFPVPEQKVPSEWLPARHRDLDRTSFPERGALLATRTAGEADGILLGFRGAADAALTLEMEDGSALRATVAELLAAPRVVAADGSGNVLLAQAHDLGVDAPLARPHAGGEVRRASLHTHSCFSTNEYLLEPVVESLRPFVRTVWWTDHNTGDDRLVLAGDFEDVNLARDTWIFGTLAARVADVGLDADAHGGERSFRLRAVGLQPEDEERAALAAGEPSAAWIRVQRGQGAGEYNVALAMDPVLRWSWKPLQASDGAPSVAHVRVLLHSGRTIRYLSAPAPPIPGTDDVVVAHAGEGWETVERDLCADARALFGDHGTDGFRRVAYGVQCRQDATTGVLFDDLELDVPPPPEVVRIQERVVGGFEALRSYVGLEQSAWLGPRGFGALHPHLIALVPGGGEELFGGWDAAPSAAERTAFVRSIQAAGGCVGAHHLQIADHFEPLMEGGGLGLNLFELGDGWHEVPVYATRPELRDRDAHGYPELFEDELHPLLVRWDRLTARGLLLSGYGAPDLHQRFDRPNDGWMNRWLTSIRSEGDSPASLLTALRGGQATAVHATSGAELDLVVEGRPWSGKLLATDRPRQVVTARVSGALPGSRLAWVRGPLVRDRAGAPLAEPEPAERVGEVRLDGGDAELALEVDASRGVFVRAELRDPAGHPVALSNPVAFVPYWPRTWPDAKVAFDWGGLALVDQEGVALTDARAEGGALLLEGLVSGAPARLALRGEGLGAVAGLAGQAPGWTERRAGSELVLADLPQGQLALRIELAPALAAALDAAPAADVLALPPRKRLLRAMDVGVPSSEAGRILDGFGPTFRGPLGLVHHRALDEGYGRFRLLVPAGEPVWLKVRTHGFSRATGRLLVDGEEVGSFTRMGAKTFRVEAPPAGDGAAAGPGAGVERVFTLVLDPDTGPGIGFLVHRIELYGGPGVVDY